MRRLVHRTHIPWAQSIRHAASAATVALSSSSMCPGLPQASSTASSGQPSFQCFLTHEKQRRGFGSGPAFVVDDLPLLLPPLQPPELSTSSRPADKAAPGGSPKHRRRKKVAPTDEGASDVKNPTRVSRLDVPSQQDPSSCRRRRVSAASSPSPNSSAVPCPPPHPPPLPLSPLSSRPRIGNVNDGNEGAHVTAADSVSDPMLLEKAKNPKEKKEKKEKKGKKEKKERKLPPSPRSPAAVTARKMAGWDKEHVPSLAAAEQLVEGVRQHLSYRYYPLKVFLDQIPDTVTARDLFQIFAGLGGSGEVEAVVVLEAMRARGRRQRTSDVRETGPRTAIIQLGDKATYDRALSDDVRMFGICWQRHLYKPTRGLGRNLFFTLSSGEYSVQDMTGKGLSVPPPPPLEELSLSFFEEGRESSEEEGEEGGTALN